MSATLPSTPQPAFILRGHTASVTAVNFHRTDSGAIFLLSGDTDGKVKLWNLIDRRCALTIHDTDSQSLSSAVLQVFPLRDCVVVQRKDGRISFIAFDWQSLTAGRELWRVDTGAYGFFRCSIRDTLLVAPATPASNIHVIDIQRRQLLVTVEGEHSTADIEPVTITAPTAIDGVLDIRAVLGHRRYGKQHGMFMAAVIYTVSAASHTHTNIVSAMEGGSILVFTVDINTGNSAMLASLSLTSGEPLISVALSLSNDLSVDTGEVLKLSGVTGGSDLSIRPFTISCQYDDTGTDISAEVSAGAIVPLASSSLHSGLNVLSFIEDGKRLATAGWDHRVRLFRCQSFQHCIVPAFNNASDGRSEPTLVPDALLRCHTKSVQCLAYSSEDASPHASRAVIPVPAATALARYSLSSRLSVIQPRQGWLATGSEDAQIAVYER